MSRFKRFKQFLRKHDSGYNAYIRGRAPPIGGKLRFIAPYNRMSDSWTVRTPDRRPGLKALALAFCVSLRPAGRGRGGIGGLSGALVPGEAGGGGGAADEAALRPVVHARRHLPAHGGGGGKDEVSSVGQRLTVTVGPARATPPGRAATP